MAVNRSNEGNSFPIPDWRRSISDVRRADSIIAVLRSAGLESIARRLKHLGEITDTDGEGRPMETESLRTVAIFLMENMVQRALMPKPQITVSYEGLLYLRWQLGQDGALGMQFLTSALIRFTATMYGRGADSQRRSVNGVLPSDDMLEAVRPFLANLSP